MAQQRGQQSRARPAGRQTSSAAQTVHARPKSAWKVFVSQPWLKRCCRYGSLSLPNGEKYRYHEYCLLRRDPRTPSCVIEDRTVTLYHLMPSADFVFG